jgi:enoyl-CoA hydratase/carnithine racemase
MSDSSVVLYEKQGAVAHVILNRPRVLNAFNMQMRDELYETMSAAKDDPEVRAVLISGAGDRGFCAGADLSEFGTAPSQVVARQVRWERDLWGLFLSMGKPLVAAVHGFVIGSGVEITCLCDVRIASDDATFRMPEAALSLVPAAGGTQTLSRNIGLGESMELLLANTQMDAQHALSTGLVHRLTDKDSVLSEAFSIAETLADLDSRAVASAKSAIYGGLDVPIDQGISLERRETARLFSNH